MDVDEAGGGYKLSPISPRMLVQQPTNVPVQNTNATVHSTNVTVGVMGADPSDPSTWVWPPDIKRKIWSMHFQMCAAEVIQHHWRRFKVRIRYLVDKLTAECMGMCKRWFYHEIDAVLRVPRCDRMARQTSVYVDMAAPEVAVADIVDAIHNEGLWGLNYVPPQFLMVRSAILMHAHIQATPTEACIRIYKHYGAHGERLVRRRTYSRRIQDTYVRMRKRKNRDPSIYSTD